MKVAAKEDLIPKVNPSFFFFFFSDLIVTSSDYSFHLLSALELPFELFSKETLKHMFFSSTTLYDPIL